MGIYLAVFINKDIRHLVHGKVKCHSTSTYRLPTLHHLTGTSKSAVAAGLIGGRVGNKGAVGISLNLSGTTLLFVNAHLAGQWLYRTRMSAADNIIQAHEGKIQHRLANWAKIKIKKSIFHPFAFPHAPTGRVGGGRLFEA